MAVWKRLVQLGSQDAGAAEPSLVHEASSDILKFVLGTMSLQSGLLSCHSTQQPGPCREDQGEDQEDPAGDRPPGTDAAGTDALVLHEYQHARLPAHRGIAGTPSPAAVDPAHADCRGADHVVLRAAGAELLHSIRLSHSSVPQTAFPGGHYLQHQPIQVSVNELLPHSA